MKEVLAIIRSERWHQTKVRIQRLGVSAFTPPPAERTSIGPQSVAPSKPVEASPNGPPSVALGAGLTHQRVLGRGRERGLRYLPRQQAASDAGVRYLPKRLISWVVEDAQVDLLVNAILEVNRTGRVGDGKIFVLPVEEAIRVRTMDRGVAALRSEHVGEMVVGTTNAAW